MATVDFLPLGPAKKGTEGREAKTFMHQLPALTDCFHLGDKHPIHVRSVLVSRLGAPVVVGKALRSSGNLDSCWRQDAVSTW